MQPQGSGVNVVLTVDGLGQCMNQNKSLVNTVDSFSNVSWVTEDVASPSRVTRVDNMAAYLLGSCETLHFGHVPICQVNIDQSSSDQ